MKDNKDESKLLASLAVFRELYDSKKDIYSIIAEFLRDIILTNAKYQFNTTEITQKLNSTFDFNLPEAVIETSLRKIEFVEKVDGFYNVTNFEELTDSGINEKQAEIEQNNGFIMNELFSFIETEKKVSLNSNEKQKIVNAFCSFLLDEEEFEKQEYLKYISAFVIKNKSNKNFVKQITTIKEGVILYTGIKYTNKKISFGTWETPLTIYIDTEVLFNFAGYDGVVYQTQFNDFLSFVNEINKNQHPKLINLKYFKDVTDEIDRFFAKAEQIATGKEKLNPSRTAMASICNGCQTASDVVSKKTKFFKLLKDNNIYEDDYQDYFLQENHKYNIS